MRNNPCWCGSGKKQKKCHKDVMSNSAFARLEEFYEQLDSKISKEIGTLPCQKGCANCCYDHFSISSVEWYYILSKIYDKYGEAKVDEVIENGYNLWIELQEKDPDLSEKLKMDLTSKSVMKSGDMAHASSYKTMMETMTNSTQLNEHPCVFLDKESQSCTIYEIRPTICRKFGVSYTYYGESTHVDGCEIIENDYEKHFPEMVDTTDFFETELGLQFIMLSKYDTAVQDRLYPIFYLCKIAKQNPNETKVRILEFKTYSLEDTFTRIVDRRQVNKKSMRTSSNKKRAELRSFTHLYVKKMHYSNRKYYFERKVPN